ncbi:MAG: hypothetical protein AB1714_06175 [Acidobacteriota bacterium]
MDHWALVTLGASIVMVLGPVVWILLRGELQRFFPYVVAASSFFLLNLVGSASPAVSRLAVGVGFHLMFASTAATLLLSYLVVKHRATRSERPALPVRLEESLRGTGRGCRRFLAAGVVCSILAMAAFWVWVTPPFFVRRPVTASREKVLQEIPSPEAPAQQVPAELKSKRLVSGPVFGPVGSLIDARIAVVASRPFHWFALAAFEIPLFIVALAATAIPIARLVGARESFNWKATFAAVLALALPASLWILSKQYLLYILAAVTLVALVHKGRIDWKIFTAFAASALVALGTLYAIYLRGTPTGYARALARTLWHRIVEVSPLGTAVAYKLFPDVIPFLGGRSLINPFRLLPYQQVSTANLVYPYVYGQGGGSIPLPAVVECYVNWGWWGVLAANIVVFILVAGVTRLCWTRDLWLFAVSCYLTMKLLLLWQMPLWFGTLEPTLVLLVGILVTCGLVLRNRHSSIGEKREGGTQACPPGPVE